MPNGYLLFLPYGGYYFNSRTRGAIFAPFKDDIDLRRNSGSIFYKINFKENVCIKYIIEMSFGVSNFVIRSSIAVIFDKVQLFGTMTDKVMIETANFNYNRLS